MGLPMNSRGRSTFEYVVQPNVLGSQVPEGQIFSHWIPAICTVTWKCLGNQVSPRGWHKNISGTSEEEFRILENEKSARSFPVMDAFGSRTSAKRKSGPGRPPGYPPRRPRDIRPKKTSCLGCFSVPEICCAVGWHRTFPRNFVCHFLQPGW